MACSRLLIVSAAMLLSVSACSTGHYKNKIPGSYGSAFKSGTSAVRNQDYDEAAEQLAFAVKSGHPRTLIAYGDLFVRGRGVDKDPARAKPLFEEAYGKSSNYKGKAAFALGRLLLDGGDGPSGKVEPAPETARTFLTEALNDGETRAASFLGRIYDQGIGVAADSGKAINYYEQVASKDATAANRIAVLLAERGASEIRVAEAADRTVVLLEAQAKEGKSRAWIRLADIYMRDQIKAPDPERAIAYLENVADDGDPAVLTRLARLYGDTGDAAQEREMLRKAADLGDKRAQTKLAKLFLKEGTKDTNGPVGRFYAERAIAQGSQASMVYLGLALLKGSVLEQDLPIAETLLRRASDQGHASGTSALGVALLRGELRSRFPGEGQKILEQAAENGSVSAMSALGFAYHTGRGLPQDDFSARQWLQRAADAGHPRAKRFLSEQTGA